MASLTPSHRSQEATDAAFHDGLWAGGLTLIPTSTAIWLAMKNPKFVRVTNWQSRTALMIMPALFTYALASELKLSHKMKEMAGENDHAKKVSAWAEKSRIQRLEEIRAHGGQDHSLEDAEKHLVAIYSKSIEESGVRIIPGESLSLHHKIANFWQENPFKILAAVAVPSVLYIFKGRSEQAHLQLQSKIMHTRVYGQFAIISMLLTIMGFKSYMDSHGKFITEQEAKLRVAEMERMRLELIDKIAFEKKMKERREELLRNSRMENVKENMGPEEAVQERLIISKQ